MSVKTVNACEGVEVRTALRILKLDFRRRLSASFTPQPTYPQRYNPQYPLNRRLGRPQSRLWKFWGDEVLAPAGNRTMDPPAHTLVTSATLCCGARPLQHLTCTKLVSAIRFWARERAVFCPQRRDRDFRTLKRNSWHTYIKFEMGIQTCDELVLNVLRHINQKFRFLVTCEMWTAEQRTIPW